MCSQKSSLSIQVTEEIFKFNMIGVINKKLDKDLSLLDFIEVLEMYKGILFYLIDLKKPIINHLKESGLITDEVFYEYRKVFDSLNINSPKPTKRPSVSYGYCPLDGKIFNYSFDYIENNIESVNWSWVSSFEHLNWTNELLIRYKDYLIFSVEKGHFQKFGANKLGQRYSVLNGIGSPKAYKDFRGSISMSKTISWSKETIEKLKDYWNWTELSENESIHWNIDLINTFADKLDFASLSGNKSVNYTEELIAKYLSRWDWKKLSGNEALPWSKAFIEKYQDKWVWIPTWEGNYFFEKSYPQPCISRNKGIYWDTELIFHFRKLIDLWRIAEYGKISDKAIIECSEDFDRNEVVGSRYCKHSDWRADENLYSTGWQNLSHNSNFKISKENIEYYYNRYTTIKYTEGNLAHEGYYVSPQIRVLEILKDCSVVNFSLDELRDKNNTWSRLLMNESFINLSIWDTTLKPLFREQFIKDFFKLVSNSQINSNEL